MTFCALVTWLLIAAIALAVMPLLADRLFPKGKLTRDFCEKLCRWWILLAFLAGVVVGGLLFCCREELVAILGTGARCRWALLSALLLLLVLLFLWLREVGRCGRDAMPVPGHVVGASVATGGTAAVAASIPALLVALLWFVRRCCAVDASRGGHASLCHWLLGAAIVLFLAIAFLKFLEARFCEEKPHENCRERLLLYARLILALLALLFGLVKICCGEMGEKDHDLAMVGIWWDGDHPGEAGAHLRWSFRHGLPFPQDGFDLERRESAGGSWAMLNSTRIHPASAWGNEAAITGDRALPNAVERIHPDVFSKYRGTPFADLADMVARDPYTFLYYVEEPSGFAAPSNPYSSETAAQAYVDLYHAQPGDEPPLATWSLEPMTTLETAALHADIARLLGLYWIDETAAPDTEYDYRIVGHWSDGTRTWTVPKLSKPRTAPLDPPLLIESESPITVSNVGGVTVIDDQAVGLTWEPPPASIDPDDLHGTIDTIEPVLFTPERMPVQAIGTDGAGHPVCPPSATGTFAPITRVLAQGTSEEIAPIAINPVEDETTGDLSWPEHFFVDRQVAYGCWAYRVQGRDIFGRPAPASSERVVKVTDLTGPPPPMSVTATLYQKADTSLPTDVRARFFPSSAPSRTFALHVTWVWSDDIAARVPDLKEFRIYEQYTNYATFPDTGWRDPTAWELTLGAPVPESAGTSPLPAAYAPVTGRFFEKTFTDTDTSLAALGLDAGDTAPVKYGWIGVAGIDHDPWRNAGVVSAPVSIFGRDFVPPGPPDPGPSLAGPIPPADERGNRSVPLSWTGNPLWTYQLWRVDAASLAPLLSPTPADLGACAAVVVKPTCNPVTDGPDCVALHLDWKRRATAVVRGSLFTRVSATPIKVEASGAATSDVVDAAVSSVKIYATAAVDAAGNAGPLSCPGAPVLVEDGIPPRTPVVTKALAENGEIRITWAENPDTDLARYTLYRTTSEGNATSRRSMQVIATLADDGSAISAPRAATRTGSSPYRVFTWRDLGAPAGTRTWYRVDAVDLAENRSPLSGAVSNQAFDATPPPVPSWGGVVVVTGTSGHAALSVTWSGESGARFQVQRREDGGGAWRGTGGMLSATSYLDPAVVSGHSYEYRVRAIDPSGNRSGWTDPPRSRTVP